LTKLAQTLQWTKHWVHSLAQSKLGVRSASAAAGAANMAVSGDVVISLSCLPVHIVLLVQLLKHQENAGCIEASLAQ